MSDNEFIARPFISHDGRDAKGVRAEVKVITGHALVVEKTKPGSRNSTMVQFKFATPDSNYPTGAWVDKEKDDELFEFLNTAYEEERSVDFRIEIQRKGNVDRSAPFEEISPPKDMEAAMKNTFKNIVAARDNDDEEWIVGSRMLTSFKEDASYGGAKKATDDDIDLPSTQPAQEPVSTKPTYREDSPYNAVLADGSANANSFAFMNTVDVIFFVRNHITAQGLSGEFSTDEEDKTVKLMLAAIGSVQKKITGDDEVSIADYSYKVAFALTKGILENYYPLKAFEDDFNAEVKNHFKMVAMMAKKVAAKASAHIENTA